MLLKGLTYKRLKYCIIISVLISTACQTNSRNSDEIPPDGQRRPVADHQVGTFDRLQGEYRGSHKGDSFVVWVYNASTVEENQQAALLIFHEEDRLRLESFLKKIINEPAEYYREVCENVDLIEDGYHFPDFYRVWNTQGGLVLLQDGFHGNYLPADWEEIKAQPHFSHLYNEEYILVREREYAIKKIRRSMENGTLKSIQLTRTGFIQNFFDNPLIHLKREDNAAPTFKLLGSYLESKFAARQVLGSYGASLPTELPEVCELGTR